MPRKFPPKPSFPAQDTVAANEENTAKSLTEMFPFVCLLGFFSVIAEDPGVSMSLKVLIFCQE